jgi:nucleoid-associated protein YgaU
VPKYVAGQPLGNVEHLFTPNRTLKIDLFVDGTGASPPLGVPVGSAFGLAGQLIKSGQAGSIGSLIAQGSAQALLSAFTVTQYINYFFGVVSAKGPFIPKDQGEVTPDVNKSSHNPNFLKLVWGKGLRFFCQLSDASVSYTLFNQLGQPLRATISATFLEVPGPEGKSRLESPDLTKVHLVTAGDTIYNIAKAEYDDESFYLQIAQANDLKNYRKLVPGQKLVLPPIAKTE